MNRCHLHFSRRLCLWALALATPVAWAQSAPPVRPFPPTAQRGAMVITAPPELLMDDKPARLSPGARIWGANRMMALSGSLVGQKLLVNYVREPLGLIHEVWILTEAEAQLPAPKAPTTP
jgi:hypothetical protein